MPSDVLVAVKMQTAHFISEDYDGKDDYSNDYISYDDRTINLNDILSGLKEKEPSKGSYKKIVLKEFPSVTATARPTTARPTNSDPFIERSPGDQWMKAGLKPPTPPFTTIWPDTKLTGESSFQS